MSPDDLKKIVPNYEKIFESSFFDSNGIILGWHATVADKLENALGSGCATDKNLARRIAIAETIERYKFHEILREKEKNPHLGIETHPNSDGFACGFNKEDTMMRAVCEAVERWVWSQWIDKNKFIPELKVLPNLNALSKHLLSGFEDASFFQKEVSVYLNGNVFKIYVGVVLAFKEGGIFPGSRASLNADFIWEHGLIEAARNHNIYSNDTGRDDIICERIKFFATNKQIALDQIALSKDDSWSEVRFKIVSQYKSMPKGIFLFRAICEDYMDWHVGPVNRFVY
jgi:ribosomal protein S12 methylthiotransferase accessory factor YcaO